MDRSKRLDVGRVDFLIGLLGEKWEHGTSGRDRAVRLSRAITAAAAHLASAQALAAARRC